MGPIDDNIKIINVRKILQNNGFTLNIAIR